MFKRIALALAFMALLAGQSFAAQTQTEMIDTTLSRTTSAAEAERYIGDADRVTFFVTYDSNRTTAAVTATVTAAVSIDGTNWRPISWYDAAGTTATQVSSATLLTDVTYVGNIDENITAPYIRIRVNLPNATLGKYNPGDTTNVTVTLVEKK